MMCRESNSINGKGKYIVIVLKLRTYYEKLEWKHILIIWIMNSSPKPTIYLKRVENKVEKNDIS